jgi:hypothetical protein
MSLPASCCLRNSGATYSMPPTSPWVTRAPTHNFPRPHRATSQSDPKRTTQQAVACPAVQRCRDQRTDTAVTWPCQFSRRPSALPMTTATPQPRMCVSEGGSGRIRCPTSLLSNSVSQWMSRRSEVRTYCIPCSDRLAPLPTGSTLASSRGTASKTPCCTASPRSPRADGVTTFARLSPHATNTVRIVQLAGARVEKGALLGWRERTVSVSTSMLTSLKVNRSSQVNRRMVVMERRGPSPCLVLGLIRAHTSVRIPRGQQIPPATAAVVSTVPGDPAPLPYSPRCGRPGACDSDRNPTRSSAGAVLTRSGPETTLSGGSRLFLSQLAWGIRLWP